MKKNKYRNPGIDGYYEKLEDDVGLGKNGGSVFVDSLDGMTADQFVAGREEAEKVKKAQKRRTVGSAVSTALAVIFGLIFVACLIRIGFIVSQYKIGDDLYDVIADEFAGVLAACDEKQALSLPKDEEAPPMQSFEDVKSNGAVLYKPSDRIKTLTSTRFSQMLVKLQELRDNNPDTFGYINIPGTKVSYPMVKGPDNSYYLTHSFTGTTLKAGSIFIDYRNSFSLRDNYNTVIYGHNMSNGAMFHSALKYLEEDFFMNTDLVIYTFDGIYTFEIFSVFETVATDQYFRIYFSGSSDFVEFCRTEESRSIFHKEGISFDADSRIITLSTCVSGTGEGRYCIHGLLKKIEN